MRAGEGRRVRTITMMVDHMVAWTSVRPSVVLLMNDVFENPRRVCLLKMYAQDSSSTEMFVFGKFHIVFVF